MANPSIPLNTMDINWEKTYGAFDNPKGITRKLNRPMWPVKLPSSGLLDLEPPANILTTGHELRSKLPFPTVPIYHRWEVGALLLVLSLRLIVKSPHKICSHHLFSPLLLFGSSMEIRVVQPPLFSIYLSQLQQLLFWELGAERVSIWPVSVSAQTPCQN